MTHQPQTATHATAASRVPWYIPVFNPILHGLLRRGVKLGPNALLTMRGRTTGEPRQVALAIIDVDGRRWVWSPFGETQWVRNLRAAGEAAIAVRDGEPESVAARELDRSERVAFFRDTLTGVARSIPLGFLFVRLVDRTDLSEPEAAADGRPVFELVPAIPGVPTR